MFTLKHIQHGIETLYPNVSSTTYRPASLHGEAGLEINFPDGSHHFFPGNQTPPNCASQGMATVYVMNENGKTVGTYSLEGGDDRKPPLTAE